MAFAPLVFQNQWADTGAITLSANGTAGGIVTIPDTRGFFVTQLVQLSNNDPKTEFFQVLEVTSETTLYVGAVSNVGDKRYRANGADVSAYTTAKASQIRGFQQNKRLPTPHAVMQAVMVADPVLALRQTPVNMRGAPFFNRGSLKTLRNSAILTASYVATSALNIGDNNAAIFFTTLTKGSLTNAMLRFDTSEDASNWFPCELERNGAVTVSGDEAQANELATVHVLTPSTGSATTYAHILRADKGHVLGEYVQARILGTGTATGSTAKIEAYACNL